VEGIRISVMDTGSGMSEEVRSRIFEPFFTTKEATGTGLGLWVSAEVVSKHHGSIRIRSRAAVPDASIPSGTVFMIFFPSVRAEEAQPETLQASSQIG
jgi:signal transduction histidine kinase